MNYRRFCNEQLRFAEAIFHSLQGCLSVAENDVILDRSKHIDVKYQMIVDNVRKGDIFN